MKDRLLDFCDDFRTSPELFVVQDEHVLKDRYRDLQLRDTSELRLGSLCIENNNDSVSTTGTGAGTR